MVSKYIISKQNAIVNDLNLRNNKIMNGKKLLEIFFSIGKFEFN